jgi:hypothetical protein
VTRSRILGRWVGVVYVLTVVSIATYGFTTESTAAILLAGAVALPTSVPAVIGYYVVYGLLAQVPGANPDSSSGSASCSSSGACQGSVSGDRATWFVFATDLTGILALTVAAVVNVALFRLVIRPRRASST